MILALIDIAAGTTLYTTTTILPNTLSTAITYFLWFKGATTIIKLPVWFGPIAFFAGIIDLLTGTALYTAATHSTTGQVTSIIAVLMLLKGGMTVLYGLIA